jgi:hypothetical protein
MILSSVIPMRSRAARLAIGTLALIAIGAAAAFLFQSEQQLAASSAALRAFDRRAREAADALADLRAGQQAYVAAGQGVTFWMPKVTATIDTVTGAIAALRPSASSADARQALDQAAATINEFADVDKRARDYLKSDQQLMAGDVIFTEGSSAAATAARHVESARLAEHQAFDALEARVRAQEAAALAIAAAIVALGLLLLVNVPAAKDSTVQSEERLAAAAPSQTSVAPPVPSAGGSAGPIMKAAADLAPEVGRVRDLPDLERLLGRAAELMDASGVVVWLGSASGADLKPVLAYGYAPQIVARMPAVPRTGNNAAAAAYRTASLQIVLSRPGGSNGAIVAPIISAEGCVGALSAEIKSGGETSETVQALAAMFAAQLANIISTAPASAEAKTASA